MGHHSATSRRFPHGVTMKSKFSVPSSSSYSLLSCPILFIRPELPSGSCNCSRRAAELDPSTIQLNGAVFVQNLQTNDAGPSNSSIPATEIPASQPPTNPTLYSVSCKSSGPFSSLLFLFLSFFSIKKKPSGGSNSVEAHP